jgi:prepilin-type N-terminal cleavage/methylation domain-containing protein
MHVHSGFTLIELLVVIAIIAVLAAILFPVFARARAAGWASACTEHLHQIYAAVKMYQLDHEYVPPVRSWWYGWDDPSLVKWDMNVVLLPYAKDKKIFACPAYGATYDSVWPDDPPAVADLRREWGILLPVHWPGSPPYGYNNGMFPDPWFDKVYGRETAPRRFDDLLRPDQYTVFMCWTTWAHVAYVDVDGGRGVVMGTEVVKADGHVQIVRFADDVSSPDLWERYKIEYWYGGMENGTAFPAGMY